MASSPLAPIDRAIVRYRQSLERGSKRETSEMIRAYGRIWQTLDKQAKELAKAIGEGEGGRKWQLKRILELQRQVEGEINRFAQYAEPRAAAAVQKAIGAGIEAAEGTVRAAYPGKAGEMVLRERWHRLPAEAIETLFGMMRGKSPLKVRLDGLDKAVSTAVRDTLMLGMAQGWNPVKVQRELRKAVGKGLEWTLNATRTAQLHAYREATRANYAANQDVVKGWVWTASKSERTCMSCLAMDGTVHPVTEPLKDHHSGRCAPRPLVASYKELGIDAPGPAASQAPRETGLDWFKKQPEAVQQRMMGKGAFEDWQAGALDLRDYPRAYNDRIYGEMLRQATLAELRGGRPRTPGVTPRGPQGTPVSDALDMDKLPKSERSELRAAINETLALINAIHGDGQLPTIPLKPSRGKQRVGGYSYYRSTGLADSIAVSRSNPHMRLTLAHEIGHFLDHQGIGARGVYQSMRAAVYGDGPLADWWNAVSRSDTLASLVDLLNVQSVRVSVTLGGQTYTADYPIDQRYVRYLLQPQELWARTYSQYIAEQSGDRVLQRELDLLRTPDPANLIYPSQWPDKDFERIAEEIEKAFRRLGWLS